MRRAFAARAVALSFDNTFNRVQDRLLVEIEGGLRKRGRHLWPQGFAAEYVGFHWNALAAMSGGMLAELYLRAKAAARKGDSTQLRQFYRKRLALPWNDVQVYYRDSRTKPANWDTMDIDKNSPLAAKATENDTVS